MNTVLTVDDERYFHAGLDKLIHWEELECRRIGEAQNGQEALELIGELRPDIIITDIRMPAIDGLELIGLVSEMNDYSPDWIILSGYDSFSYAKRAMQFGVQNYLLKPVDETELKENLRRIVEKRTRTQLENRQDRAERQLMQSAVIRRILTGGPEPDMVMRAESLLAVKDAVRYIQVIFHKVDETADAETVLRNALEIILGHEAIQRICVFGARTFGIVFSEHDVPADGVEQVAGRLHLLCRRDYPDNEVYIAVGKRVENLFHIAESYRSSQYAMNVNIMNRKHSYVLANENTRYEELSKYKTAQNMMFFADLLESISDSDRDRLEKSLEVAFEWVREKTPSQDSLRIWLNSLFIDISRIIFELDGKLDEEIQLFYRDSLSDDAFFLGDFYGSVRRFCYHCLEVIEELKKVNRTGVIMVVTDYIKSHYREQLSLRELGEHFSINPVYLGRLFKESLGIPFKQYLAETRIAEAKKLLSRTDLRVYEVAHTVGYHDCDYFSKQFLKITGKSPGAFRR